MTNPSSPIRVLVVDDEPPIRSVVRGFLEREGMLVVEAADGPAAVEQARAFAPDVVVLDIMLPGFDGIEVLRRLRAFADPSVIFLTARSEEIDRIVGLTVGGDDYLTKPFSPRELVARVQALLRRRRPGVGPGDTIFRTGDLVVDRARRDVTVGDVRVELTTLEFGILEALGRDPGVVLTRQQLLDAVWSVDFVGDDHVLEVHIGNLRRKLGDEPANPRYLETVRGVGYRLRAPDR
ncbi:MAG: response regulator transcription factor [Chloroflexota bacterium]|nr:response regulator transcription factor [Chloroflexota bacterium]